MKALKSPNFVVFSYLFSYHFFGSGRNFSVRIFTFFGHFLDKNVRLILTPEENTKLLYKMLIWSSQQNDARATKRFLARQRSAYSSVTEKQRASSVLRLRSSWGVYETAYLYIISWVLPAYLRRVVFTIDRKRKK